MPVDFTDPLLIRSQMRYPIAPRMQPVILFCVAGETPEPKFAVLLEAQMGTIAITMTW